MSKHHLHRRLAAASLAAGSLAALAAQPVPSRCVSALTLSASSNTSSSRLLSANVAKRHGDQEVRPKPPPQSATSAVPATSLAKHGYDHSPSLLPSAASQHDLISIPVLHQSSSHSHSHSGEAPLQTLNETRIFWAKGAEPLSFIEYDWAYGLGTTSELRRFTNVTHLKAHPEAQELMGFSGGRWRKLLDEVDAHRRQVVVRQLQSKLKGKTEPARHTTLLLIHLVGCIASCFVLLPVSLALRAASSKFAPLASLTYLFALLASLLASGIYKALTPRLYPENSHGTLGWVVFLLSLVCLGGDLLRLVPDVLARLCNADDKAGHKLPKTLSSLMHTRKHKNRLREQGYMLSQERSSTHHFHFSDREQSSWQASGDHCSPSSPRCGTSSLSTTGDSLHKPEDQYAKIEDRWPHDTLLKKYANRSRILERALRYSRVVVARSLPILAFATTYTGLAVYTGSCRAGFKNVCLAHGIKGGIFFWYGIMTFARFLGAYADIGWAWNKRPKPSSYTRGLAAAKSNIPSAEWVECLVCFIYGSTNSFMERFGAQTGDPWSIKQVQHVSIAVMFAGAGAVGLILETRWVRDVLSFPIALSHPLALEAAACAQDTEGDVVEAQAQPPSYQGSFNPFPALCISVVGVAMATHHQDYIWEVEIHKLWGQMLAFFGVFRCLTYFFLFLRPPASYLPSRPPTEALASFCLTTGGLVFMLSSEEISFAVMRRGYGDIMALLNMSVALVTLVFAWIALLLLLKAAAVRYEAGSGRVSRAHCFAACTRGQSYNSPSPSEHGFVLQDNIEDVEPSQPSRRLSNSPSPIEI